MKNLLILMSLLISISAMADETCTIKARRYLPEIDYAISGTAKPKQIKLKSWRECFYLATAIAAKSTNESSFDGEINFTYEENDRIKTEQYEGKMIALHYFDWEFNDSMFVKNSSGSVTAFHKRSFK